MTYQSIVTLIFLVNHQQGDNVLGSVRLSVRSSVWLSRLNHLTYDLDFWHRGRP